MTATNHALTGAVIGLVAANPLVALPAALLSHYVLDALPHYHPAMPDEKLYKTLGFKLYLMVEALLCFAIVQFLFFTHPVNWLLAAICAFVAAAPDLLSINQYILIRAGKKWKPNLYTKFASKIQWFERPTGAVVEIVWFICLVIILVKIL